MAAQGRGSAAAVDRARFGSQAVHAAQARHQVRALSQIGGVRLGSTPASRRQPERRPAPEAKPQPLAGAWCTRRRQSHSLRRACRAGAIPANLTAGFPPTTSQFRLSAAASIPVRTGQRWRPRGDSPRRRNEMPRECEFVEKRYFRLGSQSQMIATIKASTSVTATGAAQTLPSCRRTRRRWCCRRRRPSARTCGCRRAA